MLSLKPYRDTAKGLPDILNWGFVVDDGVVVNKDGSLLMGYEYSPPDMFAASPCRVSERVGRYGSMRSASPLSPTRQGKPAISRIRFPG